MSRLEREQREGEREEKKVYHTIATIDSVLPSLSSFSRSLYREEKTCIHIHGMQNNITREREEENDASQ